MKSKSSAARFWSKISRRQKSITKSKFFLVLLSGEDELIGWSRRVFLALRFKFNFPFSYQFFILLFFSLLGGEKSSGIFWGIYSKQAEIRSDCGWSERFKVEVIWGWNFLWIDYVVEILYWMLQYSWSSDGLRKSNFRDEVYVAWKLPDLELRALYVFKISLCF